MSRTVAGTAVPGLPRRRWLAGLLSVSALSACGSVRKPVAEPLEPRLITGPMRPLFYEVTGPGRAPGYLFGTMHLGAERDFPLPTLVESALAEADTLAIEIDSVQRWDELVEAFRPRVWLTEDASLETLIDATRLSQLRAFLAIAEPEWRQLRRMQPWWVAQFRLNTGRDRALDLSRDHGSERYLLAEARARDLRVVELETVAEQVDSVSGGTLSDQLAQMGSLFDLVLREDGLLGPLRRAWRGGDAVSLAALKRQAWGAPDHLPAVWQRVFEARDRRITDRLLAATTESQRLFAAIGVFHLVGPGSVPQRLREAGLTVTAVDHTLQSTLPAPLSPTFRMAPA